MPTVDLADSAHPLSTAEDLIRSTPIDTLERPVCFGVQGEDRVPFNVWDALTLLRTTKVGAFTRCPLSLQDIEAVLLTDSRLPADSPVLERYRRNYVATLSVLLCQHAHSGDIPRMRLMLNRQADINACEVRAFRHRAVVVRAHHEPQVCSVCGRHRMEARPCTLQ